MCDECIEYYCEGCDYVRTCHEEYDTGYQEWSCELLEELHNVSAFPIFDIDNIPCPLRVMYSLEDNEGEE